MLHKHDPWSKFRLEQDLTISFSSFKFCILPQRINWIITLLTFLLVCLFMFAQVFAIPGGAQAKVEDMSRALLSHVSQIPGKSFFQQVTSGASNQPLADFGKKLAVSTPS